MSGLTVAVTALLRVLVFSSVFLRSPVLHHDHGDPVRRIDMFTNEILKQQKRLHQEVLQEKTQDA